jgi:hypothetical protein
MQELRQCEFFLVRYVPDPVKNEFVNIGVLLRAAGEAGGGETLLRFTRSWSRVRCIDPDADVAALEALEAEIRQKLIESFDLKPVLTSLEDTLSNNLQITPAQGCLAENLPAKMDQLMQLLVEARKRETISRKSGRQAIYGTMRTHFERAGVWELMRKRIEVASYTARADNLRIDCGYRNGRTRMFHAVSLDDTDAAKVLAFTLAKLAAGVKRIEGLELELTAVIEPLRRRGADGELELSAEQFSIYDAGKNIMQENGIQVITTLLLPRIAEAARLELQG